MKISDLRLKDSNELYKELISLLKAQCSLRMQKSQQISKTSELRVIRRDIARVRTLLTERYKE